MIRQKRNIIILLFILFIVIIISYLIFSSGLTYKINGSVQSSPIGKLNYNKYSIPIIDSVINSSGENYVNNDVALIVKATGKYKINKLEYTFDFKEWTEIKIEPSNEVETKIIFNETMNKDIYIRAKDIKGNISYNYKTIVKIDKDKPNVFTDTIGSNIVIKAFDNISVAAIQYSNDNMNWDEELVSGNAITLIKNDLEYKYIRAVDKYGNISSVKIISKTK